VILEVQDVHTYYGDSYILQGVSIHMLNKTTIALLGRNGVGKTTLIRSIIGFTSPRRGKIIFNGSEITHLAPNQIAKLGIGLIPQGRRIFPSLNVRENLMVAARNKGAAVRNMERIFGFFPQLKERVSHPGSKLSGGEQQMLSVARALMGNPDLFLMDEPTEGLAPLLVENLKNVIQGFKQEALSVLLVEQDLGLALEIADYIYVMGQGKIVYEASPKEFRENEDVKHRYLGV